MVAPAGGVIPLPTVVATRYVIVVGVGLATFDFLLAPIFVDLFCGFFAEALFTAVPAQAPAIATAQPSATVLVTVSPNLGAFRWLGA